MSNEIECFVCSCRNIRSIPSLEMFSNLNCLSIDGNHLQNLQFLKSNFALAEIYAGNNHISNIQGSFAHLRNLRILHLQNNQISNLKNLAYELRHLTALEDLSEFNRFIFQTSQTTTFRFFVDLLDNPVTFVHGYRSTVIDTLPKLRVLDRKSMVIIDCWRLRFCLFLAVSDADRAQAYNDCHPDRRKVFDQIGFAYHLERKVGENSPRKKSIRPPIVSNTVPQVKIIEDHPTDKTPE